MSSKPTRVAKPSAVIADMDGTLAIVSDRSPYSHQGVLKDEPNAPVIETARALVSASGSKSTSRVGHGCSSMCPSFPAIG